MSKPGYCKLSRRYVARNVVSTYCPCVNCTAPVCDSGCEHNMKSELPDIQAKKCHVCLSLGVRGPRTR